MSERGMMMVARAMLDHPVLTGEPYDKRSAWLWLISEAQWKPRSRTVSGITIEAKRGEVVASLRYIAGQWKWDHKRVARFLDKLVSEGMLRQRADDGISVLTVVNYDLYQLPNETGQGRDREGTRRLWLKDHLDAMILPPDLAAVRDVAEDL